MQPSGRLIYFMANVSLNDYIPLLDFRAPKEPVYIDTTAGACAACGLLELSEHVGELCTIRFKMPEGGSGIL